MGDDEERGDAQAGEAQRPPGGVGASAPSATGRTTPGQRDQLAVVADLLADQGRLLQHLGELLRSSSSSSGVSNSYAETMRGLMLSPMAGATSLSTTITVNPPPATVSWPSTQPGTSPGPGQTGPGPGTGPSNPGTKPRTSPVTKPGTGPVTRPGSKPTNTPCPPPLPDSDWATQDADVAAALETGKANLAGVERAITNWDALVKAGNDNDVDPALLAAIGLRETDFQNENQVGGGGGRGVFQIDITKHPDVTAAQAADIEFAADYAAKLLAQDRAQIAAKYPSFTPSELLQATAAAYNFGVSNISGDPSTIDVGTTGNNYGSNVVGMMQGFKDPKTGLTPKAGTSNGGKDGC